MKKVLLLLANNLFAQQLHSDTIEKVTFTEIDRVVSYYSTQPHIPKLEEVIIKRCQAFEQLTHHFNGTNKILTIKKQVEPYSLAFYVDSLPISISYPTGVPIVSLDHDIQIALFENDTYSFIIVRIPPITTMNYKQFYFILDFKKMAGCSYGSSPINRFFIPLKDGKPLFPNYDEKTIRLDLQGTFDRKPKYGVITLHKYE